jgi:hypothetical protein
MNVVWPDDSVTASGTLPQGIGGVLTNGMSIVPPLPGGTNGIALFYAHQANYATLSTATDTNTPFLFTFYLWKSSTASSGQLNYRQYGRVGPNNFGGSSIGSGTFNNATAPVNGVHDIFGGTNYQGYNVALGASSDALFNLNNPGCPLRTVGWHKFDVERLADGSQRYYVDNVLGRTITNAYTQSIGYIVLGFRTTSSTPNVPDAVIYDGINVTTNNPSVTTQPTNQLISFGATATLSVVATSPVAYPITGYQWYFASNVSPKIVFNTNYHAIPNANSASLVINNCGLTNQGVYFVVVSNADSSVGSAAAGLTITAPSITIQPATNQTILEGGAMVLSVTAGGALPLKYQWRFNGTSIAGATTNRYSLTGVEFTNIGNYTCAVTNSYGGVTSVVATITVITNYYPNAITPLWTKLPGAYSWLTSSGSATRSLAYNSLSNQVLVASRAAGLTNIYVLDGDTGALLYTLDITTIAPGSGTYPLNCVAAADDGAIYAGNLILDGTASTYNLYAYADTAPTTVAASIWSGDPGAGVGNRWGDNLAARGAGTGTQVLIASRSGTNACIFTTDGSSWTAHTLACNVGAGDMGLGVAFGAGDTFWAKGYDGASNGLYHIAFDLTADTATVLGRYTNLANNVSFIGANAAGCFVGANGWETEDSARFYDVSDPTKDPLLLDWGFYTSMNSGFGAGNMIFANKRMYCIEDNNGILAFNINWPNLTYKSDSTGLILNWVGAYKLQSSDGVTGTYSDLPGPVTSAPYTNSAGPVKFFRLKY